MTGSLASIDLGELRDKNVLITGGLGMIGSNLAIRLVDLGAYVSIVDARLQPYGANLFNIAGIVGQVELIEADVRDQSAMAQHVAGRDLIYSLAAQVAHNDSLVDPYLDVSINYIGHLNIAESVRRHSPHARIIYPGSRLQFGKVQSNPVNEDHPQKPETPYALHKFAAEKMLEYYYSIHQIRSVCFRIANPYGPRAQMHHSKYSMVNWFIRQAMDNQPITVFGDGKQIRDYIYVDDLIEAMLYAGAANHIDHAIYNIGSGQGTAFGDMARAVVDSVGTGQIDYVDWPESYVNVETGDYITDITRIERELGWSPKHTLKQGIEKTVAYYTDHRAHYW